MNGNNNNNSNPKGNWNPNANQQKQGEKGQQKARPTKIKVTLRTSKANLKTNSQNKRKMAGVLLIKALKANVTANKQ